jgi:hypothetical protein
MKDSGYRENGIQRGFCTLVFAFFLAFSLHAAAGTGQLVVSPSSINFGSVPVGSSKTQAITLANSGGPKLTISQVSLSGTGFTLGAMNYPITLAGGQSVTCTVTFTPPSAGTDSGSVAIVATTQSSGGKKANSPSGSTTVTVAMSGTGVSSGQQVVVTVSPTSASIQTGAQQQLSASVSGTTNTAVIWTASGGTVSSGGLYTAPSSGGTYLVTATSAADTSKSASAIMTVLQSIAVSLSPTSASLQTGGQQQFTAYVSGTSNTAVTWSASAGAITTSGLYTAPNTAGTYTVKAVSAADSTKNASVTVTVSAPQAIAISISPATVSIPEKWQQQFAATVSGSSNTGVTWAITQGTGTITQSGIYTAPQAVETDVVTATSQADSTKSASATITVAAPHLVNLTWLPSSSSGISYYNVYRGTVSVGPYTLLRSGVTSTSYTDSNVQSGSTYYYVATAVDSNGMESAYSAQAQALIPMP